MAETHITLFGEEVPIGGSKPKGRQPNGYAAQPGSGPDGERCNTCKHYARVFTGSSRRWPKCGLMSHCWTCGYGSDIKARSPACKYWESKDGD